MGKAGRALLRGKPLDKDCYRATPSGVEYVQTRGGRVRVTIELETWDTHASVTAQWLKVLEEIDEAQKEVDEWRLLLAFCDVIDKETRERRMERIADELADVVQAVANLTAILGVNMAEAQRRCTDRQRERGRL